MTNPSTAVVIRHLSKSYKKYVVPFNTLKSFALNYARYRRESQRIGELQVIRDLSLDIREGEFFCVIGKNGAGKSTLAKLIAGTLTPTEGSVRTSGRIVPFLELGVAFSAELSGRDNVMLNGVMLGLSRRFLKEKMDDIFRFAGVESFMDTPVKYYSSGMQMRLAFSIGMNAEGDIYIFDEILAVGDANFQKKCVASFSRLMEEKKTIIFITHDLDMVKRHADRALLLRDGAHFLLERGEIQRLTEEDLMR